MGPAAKDRCDCEPSDGHGDDDQGIANDGDGRIVPAAARDDGGDAKAAPRQRRCFDFSQQ